MKIDQFTNAKIIRKITKLSRTCKNGFTVSDVAAHFTLISRIQIRYILNRLVEQKKLYRYRNDRWNQGCLVRYYGSEQDGQDDYFKHTEIILQLLQQGERLNQYWQNTANSDPQLHTICKRLWMQGQPILRQKNPETGLIEYYFINLKKSEL